MKMKGSIMFKVLKNIFGAFDISDIQDKSALLKMYEPFKLTQRFLTVIIGLPYIILISIGVSMLYFGTNFTYLSSPLIVHSPKITVSDGITTKVYTLSLNKSVRVIIDLLAATLTAYDTTTGEIVQQRKIFETVVGYKSIDYEDFDDILGDKLTVLIGGRSVE